MLRACCARQHGEKDLPMPRAIPASQLPLFQCLLIGTWASDNELRDGDGLPLSFNVMPLPQVEAPPDRTMPPGTEYGGFILKNFAFCETIRFNGSNQATDPPRHRDPEALAVVASAPNRGGTYTQTAQAVFYDQQVMFAEGPGCGTVVHVENGAWLYFASAAQMSEPYGDTPVENSQVLKQPPYITVAKQISVPHGNSVLALGNVDRNDGDDFNDNDDGLGGNTILKGAPIFPDGLVPYPAPADTCTAPFLDVFATNIGAAQGFENPNPVWTRNPSRPLQLAVEKIQPQCFMHWRVTTMPLPGGQGSVTNVPFEQQKSNVVAYWADYWMLSQDEYRGRKERMPRFDYLAYTQTILMDMMLSTDGGQTFRMYRFPHVTCNTVKRLPGTPTEERAALKDGVTPCVTCP